MKTKSTKQFLDSIFTRWYGNHNAKIKEIKKPLDFRVLKDDVDSSKFGEFIDKGKTGKYKVVELPEMVGKPIYEVREYLVKKYGENLPGLEAMQKIMEKGTPLEETRDYRWYYFFGSSFRISGGSWFVPCVYGRGLEPYGRWLVDELDSGDRVVLLDDSELAPLPSPDFDSLDFDLRLKKLEEFKIQVENILKLK